MLPRSADRPAAATIVAKSFLSFARVLARSFHAHHPDIPFFVLIADEPEGFFDPSKEPFTAVSLAELDIPRIERFRFHYAQQPFSYALTPYLLSHLLGRGFSSVIFFKQETLVLDALPSLFDAVRQASIVLTPHLLAPLTGSDGTGRELNILLSGIFNVGVLGVGNTPVAHRFLGWWASRTLTHSRHAIADGMHFEQRWLDLVPAMFEDVLVLRDSSYNVAHWNLPERRVTLDGDRVLIDGNPGRVFRFSGYDPDVPTAVTRYNDRLAWETLGPARFVFERFRQALLDEGFATSKLWPYAFGSFDNGAPVPDLARRVYLDLGSDANRFGDPLCANSPSSYFRWLCDLDGPEKGGVPRIWRAVHQSRPDLQQAFPDLDSTNPDNTDRRRFLEWAAETGVHEHRLSSHFLPAGIP